jgi:hypothetical protein
MGSLPLPQVIRLPTIFAVLQPPQLQVSFSLGPPSRPSRRHPQYGQVKSLPRAGPLVSCQLSAPLFRFITIFPSSLARKISSVLLSFSPCSCSLYRRNVVSFFLIQPFRFATSCALFLTGATLFWPVSFLEGTIMGQFGYKCMIVVWAVRRMVSGSCTNNPWVLASGSIQTLLPHDFVSAWQAFQSLKVQP